MEIALINYGSSGGGAGVTETLRQQTTVTTGNTIIVVTVNGGILPTSDNGVLVSGPTGILPQGIGITGGYTIDRVSVPNEIVLNNPVFGNILFIMQFFYE